jgi:hypothetical protein
MAGPMIPPEILHRKSLFSRLHKIDQDLAEQTRARRCPFAGGRCITPTTHESLEAVPLVFQRLLSFGLACAAAVKVAGVVSCRHLFGFGSGGFTGRLSCLSSPPFAKEEIRTIPWSNSKAFSVYGGPPSTVGSITFVNCFPKPSATGVWPDT